MSESIITKYTDFCLICGKPAEIHHCPYGTSNRKIADREGLLIPLCSYHHREGKLAAHKCKEVDMLLHAISELAWEKRYYMNRYGAIDDESRDAFRKLFGKNWI
jgi:hypothetical protein